MTINSQKITNAPTQFSFLAQQEQQQAPLELWDDNCEAFIKAIEDGDEHEMMELIPHINPNAYHLYSDSVLNVKPSIEYLNTSLAGIYYLLSSN